MFINSLGGPALVRAYALELLVDAAQQHNTNRPQSSRRRSAAALGWVLGGTGRLLIRWSDWLARRSVTPPMIDICS
jgi:hypothetical protein